MMYLVTIQDKTLYREPDVALAVVDAADEESALLAARPTIEQLADAGRGRCVPHVRQLEPGKFYRLGAVVRIPYDPNADDDELVTLPELPCPRCGNADTVPLRNYGRPMVGDTPGTSRWQCLECKYQFDGPKVKR